MSPFFAASTTSAAKNEATSTSNYSESDSTSFVDAVHAEGSYANGSFSFGTYSHNATGLTTHTLTGSANGVTAWEHDYIQDVVVSTGSGQTATQWETVSGSYQTYNSGVGGLFSLVSYSSTTTMNLALTGVRVGIDDANAQGLATAGAPLQPSLSQPFASLNWQQMGLVPVNLTTPQALGLDPSAMIAGLLGENQSTGLVDAATNAGRQTMEAFSSQADANEDMAGYANGHALLELGANEFGVLPDASKGKPAAALPETALWVEGMWSGAGPIAQSEPLYVGNTAGATDRQVVEEEYSSSQGIAGACFAAGTPLLTPSGDRPIEQFVVGDAILSRLEGDPEAPFGVQIVEEVFVRDAVIWRLLAGGKQIETTGEHPFWVDGRGWVAARELQVGDRLRSHLGRTLAIDDIVETGERVTVYNLRVSDWHTYFVGGREWEFSVWAHNADYSGGPGPAPSEGPGGQNGGAYKTRAEARKAILHRLDEIAKNGEANAADIDFVRKRLDKLSDENLISFANVIDNYRGKINAGIFVERLHWAIAPESPSYATQQAELLQRQYATLEQAIAQIKAKEAQQDEITAQLAEAKKQLQSRRLIDLEKGGPDGARVWTDNGELIGVARLKNGLQATFLLKEGSGIPTMARVVELRGIYGEKETLEEIQKRRAKILYGPTTTSTVAVAALDFVPLGGTANTLAEALEMWERGDIDGAKRLLLMAGISFVGDVLVIAPGISKLGDKAAKQFLKGEERKIIFAPNKPARLSIASDEPTCFVAGTPLLTPEGQKAIEQFNPGDLILSRPEADCDAPIEVKEVEHCFVRVAHILEIHVGGQIIETTAEHPFYVRKLGWRCAHQLEAGDELNSHDGQWIAVQEVVDREKISTVYNLRVADYHTYFVGSRQWSFSVWAHNALYEVRDVDGKLTLFKEGKPVEWDLARSGNTGPRTFANRAEADEILAELNASETRVFAKGELGKLRELDIAPYGDFNIPSRANDKLAGHEVIQNAWLKATGKIEERGVGAVSRNNPALAVGKALA